MRKWLPISLIVTSSLWFLPSLAANIKSGSACTKLGQVQISNSYKFTCIKSGKKLIWGPGVLVKSPSPTPSPTPTLTLSPTPLPTPTPSPTPTLTPQATPSPSPVPTPTTSTTPEPLLPINQCKLKILDGRGDVAIGGFPRIADRLKSTGKVVTKVIFVDFADQPASMTPQEAFSRISQSADLFTELSYGRMQFTLEPTYKWYHMKGTAKSYAPLNQSFLHHRSYISEALAMADPDIDFSSADAILVVSNPDAKDIGTSGPAFASINGNGFLLDGRYIANGATSAYDLNYWKYIWLNHEFGHTLGLVDLYAFNPEDSTNPYDYHRFVGEFSLMGLSSLDANSPGYLAWERWLLGWIDDSQIYCMTEQTTSQLLSPVERSGGTKAVIVPISASKVVVVESRRAEGVDKNLKKAGALVYVVDSTIQSGYGPVRVFPADKSDPRRLQSPRAEGESVTVEGITVTVKTSSTSGDQVEITRK